MRPFSEPMRPLPFQAGRGLDIHPGSARRLSVEQIPGGLYFGDDEARHLVVTRLQTADDYRRFHEERWARLYAEYKQVIQTRRDGSNYPSSEFFVVVETILPRVLRAFFSVKPAFKVMPTSEVGEERAEMIEALLWNQWTGSMKIEEAVEFLARQAVKYGTGISKVVWTSNVASSYHELLERDQNGIPTGRVLGQIEEQVKNESPRFIPMHLYDFWIEPAARSIEEADYVIHRTWTPLPVLQELQRKGVYRNVDQLGPTVSVYDAAFLSESAYRGTGGTGTYGRPYKHQRAGAYSPFNYQDRYAPLVEVLEYWGTAYGSDRMGQLRPIRDRVITIANRHVVLRNGENPLQSKRKPFFAVHAHKDEDEFYSMGFLEPLERTAIAGQGLTNMMIDNVVYAINNQYLVSRSARLPVSSIRPRPHGTIPVDDISGVVPLPKQDIVPSAHILRQWFEQRGKVISGTTDFVRGDTSTGGSDTATEVVQGIQQGNLRFDLFLGNFKSAFREGLLIQHEMNQQFLSVEQVIKMTGQTGEEWRRVSRQDIGGSVDFVFHGDESMASDQALQQRSMLLFERLLSDPEIRASVDMRKVLKRMFDIFRVSGSEDFLLDPDRFETLAYLSSTPQEEFYRLLVHSVPMQVMPGDDDAEHLLTHRVQWEMVAGPPFNAPHLRAMLLQHMMEHESKQKSKGMLGQSPIGPQGMGPSGPEAFAGAGSAPMQSRPTGGSQVPWTTAV